MNIILNNFASATATSKGVDNGMASCDPNVDLNCDGVIQAWEAVNEVPRVIFGTVAAAHLLIYIYLFFADEYFTTYGFGFENLKKTSMSLGFLFAWIFSFVEMAFWFISYAESEIVLDIFYIYS